MSEKEKEIMKRFSESIPKLDKEKQNYVLGVVEGMAIAKDESKEKVSEQSFE